MTLVAVITQAIGRYCLESVSPAFAHVWVSFTPPKAQSSHVDLSRSWSPKEVA